MLITLRPDDALYSLDANEITRIISRVLTKLGKWFRKEAIRNSTNIIKIKYQSKLEERILAGKKNKGQSLTLWLGIMPFGMHHFGEGKRAKGGVTVGDEYIKNSFITYFPSRDKTPRIYHKNSQGKIRLTTRSIDKEIKAISDKLSMSIDAKFNVLLEAELNAVL